MRVFCVLLLSAMMAIVGCSRKASISKDSEGEQSSGKTVEPETKGSGSTSVASGSTSASGGKPKKDPLVFKDKHLDVWLEDAKNNNKDVRMDAADALGRLGKQSPEALDKVVPALAVLLEDEAPRVRQFSAASLKNLGGDVKAAAPALAKAVRNNAKDAQLRKDALEALVNAGPNALGALPDIMELLDDPDPNVRAQAMRILRQIPAEPKEVLPTLKKALGNKDNTISGGAVDLLVKMGEPAIPTLIDALQDKEVKVNSNAAVALKQLGPKAKLAVPALIVTLNDVDGKLRERSADALANIGPDAAPATDVLMKKLRDDDCCSSAARALIKIGAKETQIPELIDVLKDGSASNKPPAANVLIAIGKPSVPPLLALAAANNDTNTLAQIAYALGKIGDGSPEVKARLLNLLQDNEVGGEAKAALRALGLDQAIMLKLFEIVRKKDGFGHAEAAELLVDPKIRKEAFPFVNGMLGGKGSDALEPKSLEALLGAVEKLGAEGKGCSDNVLSLVKHEDEGVKAAAARTLKKIDPETAKSFGIK